MTDAESVSVKLEAYFTRFLILINGEESGDLLAENCCVDVPKNEHLVAENLSGTNTITLYQ